MPCEKYALNPEKEQKKVSKEMLYQQIIAPVTQPTELVSSLSYLHKPDVTLCIYLNPQDLNKAII